MHEPCTSIRGYLGVCAGGGVCLLLSVGMSVSTLGSVNVLVTPVTVYLW